MTLLHEISEKERIRSLLKDKRRSLSFDRRKEARDALTLTLLPLLKSYKAVLSFYSLPEEIDLCSINQHLAEEGKLHLPKIQNEGLKIHFVTKFNDDLLQFKSKLLEPDPSKCLLIDPKNIDCILVPGLGFDKDHRRIGYGKGHYDKLLGLLIKRSLFPKMIGIGFKEQYYEDYLPHEPHDIPLDEVKLF